uniref:MIP20324p n=1 Tax=Drosophila melanogaster TaxID=7227 RepID=D5A7Q1_DROME|nr:MIP20324p [Drosophila melanogaster]
MSIACCPLPHPHPQTFPPTLRTRLESSNPNQSVSIQFASESESVCELWRCGTNMKSLGIGILRHVFSSARFFFCCLTASFLPLGQGNGS